MAAMPVTKKSPGSRREFLRGALRYGLAASLVAVGGLAARKSNGQTCINRGLCNGCEALPDCGLPRALSVKLAKGQPQ